MQRTVVATAARAIAGAALAAAVAVPVIALVVPRLTGGAALTVVSGSMEPTIPTGSLVFVRPVDPSDVGPGDVITIQPDGRRARYVTHRVVEVLDTRPVSFITKGDANEGVDTEPVPADAVRAEFWFHLAGPGHYRDWIASPHGLGVIAVTMVGLWAVPAVARMVAVRRQRPEASMGSHTAGVPSSDDGRAVRREVILFTVRACAADRHEIARLVQLMGGEVIDVNHEALTASMCGSPAELDDLERLVDPWDPIAVVRSGPVAVAKLDPSIPRVDRTGLAAPGRVDDADPDPVSDHV